MAQLARQSTPGTDAHRDACLARAQIAAGAGNHAAAVDALTAVVDERFAKSPARAATLVALHELAGDVDAADAVLDDIASVKNAPVEVAIRAADRALSRGRAEAAAEAYEEARARADAEATRNRATSRARASPPRWSPRATSTPPNETRRFFSRRSSRRAGVRFRTRTRSRRLYPRASSSAPPIWNERSDAERVADAAPRTAKGRGGERRGRER